MTANVLSRHHHEEAGECEQAHECAESRGDRDARRSYPSKFQPRLEAGVDPAAPSIDHVNMRCSFKCDRMVGATTVPRKAPTLLAAITAPSSHAGWLPARSAKPKWNMAYPTAARRAIMSHMAPVKSTLSSSTMSVRRDASVAGNA